MTTALAAEIGEVLDRFCACWNEHRMGDIPELWDVDDAAPFCLPAEIEAPLTTWDALREHYRRSETRLEAASMRTAKLNVKLAAPDIAVALYEYHWNGAIAGRPLPAGVDTRVTAIFRRRPEGWRFIHYIEAPLAFAVLLPRLMAAQVDPAFLERLGPVASEAN